MLKVVVNAVAAKSGGAATYLRNLSRELARSDHQFIIFAPAGVAAACQPSAAVRLVPTDVGARRALWRLLWDQVVFRAHAQRLAADVVVSSSDFGVLGMRRCRQMLMVRNPLFFSRLYERHVLARKSRRFRAEFRLRRRLVVASVRAADVVMTATASMLDDLRGVVECPPGRAIVNAFGVPRGKFTAAGLRSEEGRPLRLLFVSEYSDYKNLTVLLRAMLVLRRRGASVRLVTTAGPDQFPNAEIVSREEDRALLAMPELAACVQVVGPVRYDEIQSLYSACDVFVFPSLAESFGHPLVEAMMSGLPIVASDIPVHREVCGPAAVYFAPLDAEALAESVQRLAGDRSARARMSREGRARAEAEFDWSRHVRRFVEVVEKAASCGTT